MQIGLREANQRFARIVRAVKRGADVGLTERGRPGAGVLRAARRSGSRPRWRPRPPRGAPLSETIREERERS